MSNFFKEKMIDKVYETIIIGAGIAGLACARRLQEKDREAGKL